MPKAAIRTGGAIALALASNSGGAQQPDERVRDARPAVPSSGENDERDAQRVMNAYGRCILKRSRRSAERFLAFFPNSPEARQPALRLATSDCLADGQLRFKYPLFRGSLFEALYLADFGRRPVADIEHAAPLSYAPDATTTMNPSEAAVETELRNFADCVVRANPSDARALILSKVATSQEAAAFGALRSNLAPCLPQGVELKFSRPILRGLIGEVLYRLSAARNGLPALGGGR